jgi:hypothetical protein
MKNTTYQETMLVEAFHTSLRKYCDSPQSWGLWHWINHSVDNKHSEIVGIFWETFYETWRMFKVELKKNNLKCTESNLKKYSKKIHNTHLKKMEDSVDLHSLITNDSNKRSLYYMMRGLYVALPENDLMGILYSLKTAKVE